MKTIPYITLAITVTFAAMSEAVANGEQVVLCKMLASSLSNPWQFDEVIDSESDHFDKSMMQFIQTRVKQLTGEAKQHEAVCEPYTYKSMRYDQCMGSNTARELATWLSSLMQASQGSRWEQTEFGADQLKIWNACNNPAFCEQLRSAAAVESRRVCPLMFGNNS